jgi:hypothetical protein
MATAPPARLSALTRTRRRSRLVAPPLGMADDDGRAEIRDLRGNVTGMRPGHTRVAVLGADGIDEPLARAAASAGSSPGGKPRYRPWRRQALLQRVELGAGRPQAVPSSGSACNQTASIRPYSAHSREAAFVAGRRYGVSPAVHGPRTTTTSQMPNGRSDEIVETSGTKTRHGDLRRTCRLTRQPSDTVACGDGLAPARRAAWEGQADQALPGGSPASQLADRLAG